MATHSIFGNNPVEIASSGLVVAADPGAVYRIGTLFYTSGGGTTGWRCKGARIYVAADDGGETMPATVTLSLWVQSTIDAATLGTTPLRTGTVNTAGRPGWFEVVWDSVEVTAGQTFMVSYEGANTYQYVPGTNTSPYDDSVQASDGSSLFLSEHGGATNRGYFYDVNTSGTGNFQYYTGLDVLIDDDSTAPTAPTALTATVDGQTVALRWGMSTDDVEVTGYRVYRDTVAGFSASASNRVATTGVVASFTDILFTSDTYYYQLSAVDGAGNESAVSGEVACSVTVDGTGVYLYPSDLGWTTGASTTDTAPGGQTLGTRFSVTQPSPIAGVRFYAPTPMNNNTIRLWGDGTLRATVPSVSFVAGWNVCLFDVPHAGVAGIDYVASVYMGSASQTYTAQPAQFSTTRTTVGTAYSEADANGLYDGGDVLPTQSFQSAWYGIDAIVVAPPARTGSVQRWDGTAWQSHALKRWDGASWVRHSAMGYDGVDFIKGK